MQFNEATKMGDRDNYVQHLKSPELINSVAQEPEGSSPRSQQHPPPPPSQSPLDPFWSHPHK
jgi:hypothetical protein